MRFALASSTNEKEKLLNVASVEDSKFHVCITVCRNNVTCLGNYQTISMHKAIRLEKEALFQFRCQLFVISEDLSSPKINISLGRGVEVLAL